jgi:hypothetical protein
MKITLEHMARDLSELLRVVTMFEAKYGVVLDIIPRIPKPPTASAGEYGKPVSDPPEGT